MNPELSKKYENAAWEVATEMIGVYLGANEMDRAKLLARQTIENWEEEGKAEKIKEFKEWLKNKNVDIDPGQAAR